MIDNHIYIQYIFQGANLNSPFFKSIPKKNNFNVCTITNTCRLPIPLLYNIFI